MINRSLVDAARQGNVELVRELLDSKADINMLDNLGQSALMKAAQRGDNEIVKMLLDSKAEIDQASDLRYGYGYSALMYAAQYGQTETVQILLDKKAAINQKTKGGYFDTPLIVAAYKGHIEVVRTLLNRNADIFQQNRHNETALTSATTQRHYDIVEVIESYIPKAQKIAFLQAGTNAEQKINNSPAVRFFKDPICDRYNIPKIIFDFAFPKPKSV